MADSSKGSMPSEDEIRQILAQMMKESPFLQPAGSVDNAQSLMLLPFKVMRRHLESAMLRQLEIACGICLKNATELDRSFMTHVEKFEEAIKAELEEFYGTWQ